MGEDMDNPLKILGKRIKELRLKAGLSHEKLAKILGISQGAISQWEAGYTSPKGKRRRPLADALGVSEASLFSSEPPEVLPFRSPKAEDLLEVFIQGSEISQERKLLLRALLWAEDEELFIVRNALSASLDRLRAGQEDKSAR